MIVLLALLAAGLVPPSNGVRFVERDPIAEILRDLATVPPKTEPSPKKLARLRGWVPASRITPRMRRWADKVLEKNERIGAFAIRRFGKRDVLGRVEWHRHGDGPWHRGVTLYVRSDR